MATDLKKLDVQIFAPIQKMDEEKRMVYGYATTPATDTQEEVVDLQASFDAVDEWQKWANIKEMHRPETAVGVAPVIEKHAGVGVYIGAKIVDDQAWKKCVEKVYKGFSIGGRVVEREGKRITKYKLYEISLVDRPANPDTLFAVCKRDFTDDADASEKEADGGKVMEKNDIPPTTEAVAPAVEKAEAAVSKPEAETISLAKADYEKQTARLAELEKALATKAKEDEAKSALLKMIDELKPVIKKEYEEVKPVEQTPEQKEAELRAQIEKMSIGELSAYMFKSTKESESVKR